MTFEDNLLSPIGWNRYSHENAVIDTGISSTLIIVFYCYNFDIIYRPNGCPGQNLATNLMTDRVNDK